MRAQDNFAHRFWAEFQNVAHHNPQRATRTDHKNPFPCPRMVRNGRKNTRLKILKTFSSLWNLAAFPCAHDACEMCRHTGLRRWQVIARARDIGLFHHEIGHFIQARVHLLGDALQMGQNAGGGFFMAAQVSADHAVKRGCGLRQMLTKPAGLNMAKIA